MGLLDTCRSPAVKSSSICQAKLFSGDRVGDRRVGDSPMPGTSFGRPSMSSPKPRFAAPISGSLSSDFVLCAALLSASLAAGLLPASLNVCRKRDPSAALAFLRQDRGAGLGEPSMPRAAVSSPAIWNASDSDIGFLLEKPPLLPTLVGALPERGIREGAGDWNAPLPSGLRAGLARGSCDASFAPPGGIFSFLEGLIRGLLFMLVLALLNSGRLPSCLTTKSSDDARSAVRAAMSAQMWQQV